MSYQACFKCDLLFEVRKGDDALCTQCGGPLVKHEPTTDKAASSTPAIDAQEPTRMIIMTPSGQLSIDEPDDQRKQQGIHTGTRLIGSQAKTKDRRSIHRRKGAREGSSQPKPDLTDTAPPAKKGIHTGTNLIDAAELAASTSTSAESTALPDSADSIPPLEQTRMIPKEAVEQLSRSAPEETSPGSVTDELDATRLVKASTVAKGAEAADSETGPLETNTPKSDVSAQLNVPDPRFAADVVPDAIGEIVSAGLAEAERYPLQETTRTSAPTTPWVRRTLYGALFISLAILGIDQDEPEHQPINRTQAENPPPVESMQDILRRVGVRPIKSRMPEPAECDGYVIAGAETIELSGEPIPGLGSSQVSGALVSSDPDGPWIQKLTVQLEGLNVDEPDTFCLALPEDATAYELFVFGHSAQRAGFRRTGLLLETDSKDVELGILPYRTRIATMAQNARIVLRVGRLGVYTEVIEPDGTTRGDKLAPIAMLDDGQLDHRQIDSRLARLKELHSDIRIAVIEVNRDLSVFSTARLFEHTSTGTEGERFTRIQLRLR